MRISGLVTCVFTTLSLSFVLLQAEDDILFSKIGYVTREASYSHLVAELPIEHLKKAAQGLSDMSKSLSIAMEYKGEELAAEKLAIQQVLERIRLVADMANGAKNVDKNYFDMVNQTMVGITKRRTGRTRRSLAVMASVILGMASFGQGFLTQTQIRTLEQRIENRFVDNQFVIEDMNDKVFRIMNITKHIDNRHRAMIQELKKERNATQYLARKTYETTMRTLYMTFRLELQDFLQGLTMLMDNRLSPFLIDADKLKKSYQHLIEEATSKKLRVISEDTGILFQSEAQVLAIDGRLIVVVNVPLYDGSYLEFFEFYPAPLYIPDTDMVIEILPQAKYLAIDDKGHYAKELSLSQKLQCKRFQKVYHCPGLNVLHRELDDLCLVALYSQRFAEIERICPIQVSKLTHHVVQLSSHYFRVLSVEQIQLIYNCKQGRQLEIVQGVFYVNLTERCPVATTPFAYMTRSTELYGKFDIFNSPRLPIPDEWLSNLLTDLNTTSWLLDEMATHSLPLTELNAKINSLTSSWYYNVVYYFQAFVIYAGFLYMSYRAVTYVKRRFMPKPYVEVRPRHVREDDAIMQPLRFPAVSTSNVMDRLND